MNSITVIDIEGREYYFRLATWKITDTGMLQIIKDSSGAVATFSPNQWRMVGETIKEE